MRLFGKFTEKDKFGLKDDVFARHGFVKLKDSKKKIYVILDETRYQFNFETNTIYEIPSKRIKFAICIRRGERLLFINTEYRPLGHTTSPYRTFYNGLMNKPFKYCYPFDDEVIIETEEEYGLIFFVKELG